MPERASLQAKLTVTGLLFQPAALAAGVREPTIIGMPLSMLMLPRVTVAVLPAWSEAVPETLWPLPSVETVTGAGQVSTPERVSAQAKVTVTSVLFQPSGLASSTRAAVTDGAVRSMLTPVRVAEALLPARSVAVPLAPRLVPSALRVTGLGQLSMPERASVQVKLMATGVLFQP